MVMGKSRVTFGSKVINYNREARTPIGKGNLIRNEGLEFFWVGINYYTQLAYNF